MDKTMPLPIKNIFYYFSLAIVVLAIGFALSSGIALDAFSNISEKAMSAVSGNLRHHVLILIDTDAKHYFLVPFGCYSKELLTAPISFVMLASILTNTIFNILFQPVFISALTPQFILNLIIFPFFLYGSIVYFRKTWFMLVLFIAMSIQIGIYDSVVEALIRHGMSCELIYLLVGTAGFTGWTTKNL